MTAGGLACPRFCAVGRGAIASVPSLSSAPPSLICDGYHRQFPHVSCIFRVCKERTVQRRVSLLSPSRRHHGPSQNSPHRTENPGGMSSVYDLLWSRRCTLRTRQDRAAIGHVPATADCQSTAPPNAWKSPSHFSNFYSLCWQCSFLRHPQGSLVWLEASRRHLRKHVRHLDRRRSARLHCFPLEQIAPRNDSCDFRPRCDCCGSVRASGRPGARQVAPGFASSGAPCPAEAGFIAARARSPGPLVRMLRASRRESSLAAALFLACWTTALLLPNPLMPASVARSHFWETLGFSLVFGALAGWLLSLTPPVPQPLLPTPPSSAITAGSASPAS